MHSASEPGSLFFPISHAVTLQFALISPLDPVRSRANCESKQDSSVLLSTSTPNLVGLIHPGHRMRIAAFDKKEKSPINDHNGSLQSSINRSYPDLATKQMLSGDTFAPVQLSTLLRCPLTWCNSISADHWLYPFHQQRHTTIHWRSPSVTGAFFSSKRCSCSSHIYELTLVSSVDHSWSM